MKKTGSSVSEAIRELRKMLEMTSTTGVGAFVTPIGSPLPPPPFPKLPGLDEPDKRYRKMKKLKNRRR